jgi:hypothetical protein
MSLISKHVLLGFASLGFVSLIRGFHLRREYSQVRNYWDLRAFYGINSFYFMKEIGRYEYRIGASECWSIGSNILKKASASMFMFRSRRPSVK